MNHPNAGNRVHFAKVLSEIGVHFRMVFPSRPAQTSAYRLIKRTDLLNLTFADQDALSSEAMRQERWGLLHKATFQGNVEERKVTIFFTAEQGRFALNTTIWACTEQTVVFKDSEQMPIRAVEAVEFHQSSEEE